MPSSTNFHIDLEPSRRLAVLLGAMHSLAVVAVWLSLSGWPLVLTVAGIAASAVATLSRALHLAAGAAVRLELDPSGKAAWRDRAGRWRDARLGADHLVSNWLVAICVAPSMSRRKWIVVLPDSVSTEQFRQLRVWLRWRREPTQSGAEKPTAAD